AILSLSPALPDGGRDLLWGMTGPERGTEIDAARGVETEVPHSVGGQAAAIAALAERIGCRGNDSEDGAVPQRETIRRCGRVLDDRCDLTVMLGESLEHFLPRHDASWRPMRGTADVHILDEAHFAVDGLSVLDQVDELIVVHVPDHDTVD